ncbi:hypothetical protein PG984_007749 [Apiospora sp. TS-2023a]
MALCKNCQAALVRLNPRLLKHRVTHKDHNTRDLELNTVHSLMIENGEPPSKTVGDMMAEAKQDVDESF